MMLLNFLFAFFLLLFLSFRFAVEAAQRTIGRAPRELIGEGEVTEVLSVMEAKALESETKNDWSGAASYYREASRAARISGQVQKAVSYGNKAFEMGEKAKDPSLQAQAISEVAQAYRRLGQPTKSREWLEKGIEIAKQLPQQRIGADLYKQLGVDFLRQREAQKAIEYISYSLRFYEERLAILQNRRQKNPQAIRTAQTRVVTSLAKLGSAYQIAGDINETIKTYEKGLKIIRETGLKTHNETELYLGLGELYLGQKNFTRAQENLTNALEIAEKVHNARIIQHAASQMGNLLLQAQQPSEAVPFYKKAIASIESTRSLLESEEFRSSFFENKRQTYSGVILAYIGEKNWEEAFNYSERARSRAFLDILGSKVQLSSGTLLEEERAFQAKISALQAKMTEQEEDEDDEEAPEPGQLRRELDAAQKAYDDFLSRVREENKEQASLMSVEPLNLKEVQELLRPEVTMLEYFVVNDEVLLWVVDKKHVASVRVPVRRKDLVSKVTAVRDSIYQLNEKEKFKTFSQELYKLLIEAALPQIQGKELAIIPHDVLHYLPFQALLSGEGRYLIQDYPMEFLSSASLMQFTREKERNNRETALAFGNPSLGDDAYNLRFAEREVKEIAQDYPKTTVFVREQATKSKAVSLSPNNDILHFAVHAEFNAQDPMESALLLAKEGNDDGKLRVGEIFSLNLKADLVVLSACETGLGKINSGDEIVGLTRAFIYAGTPSIITTLWKVNDQASYELMRGFYANLKTMKKSEALRQAQLKTMKEFPQPFFWAAYGLTGEP